MSYIGKLRAWKAEEYSSIWISIHPPTAIFQSFHFRLLNYLIEKVQKGFNRHHHSRVLRALDFLNIHWQGLEWQAVCAWHSKVLHYKMREISVNDNESALEGLRKMQEYWSLIKLIDEHVDQDGLEMAVKLLGEEEKNNENNDYFIPFLT